MKLFYYNIKGKFGEEGGSAYGGNWSFPPIWTDFIEAESREAAKAAIEAEYGRKFPTRVLAKDLDSNEFLLTVKEVKSDDKFTLDLNEVKTCKNPDCGRGFKIIEKYQHSETGGGRDYCCYACSKAHNAFEFITAEGTKAHLPVIYKITQKQSGKCYIGQTTQPFTLRWYQHFFQGTENKFHTAITNTSISDWSFEVLEVIDARLLGLKSANDLKEYVNGREHYYIVLFDAINNGYNSIGKYEVKNPNELELFAGEVKAQ